MKLSIVFSFIFLSLTLVSCGKEESGEKSEDNLGIRTKMSAYEQSLGLQACKAMNYKRLNILTNHDGREFPFALSQKNCSGETNKVGQGNSSPYLLTLNSSGTEFIRPLGKDGKAKDKRYLGKILSTVQSNRNGELDRVCSLLESGSDFGGRFEDGDEITQYAFTSSGPKEINIEIVKGVKDTEADNNKYRRTESMSMTIFSSYILNSKASWGMVKTQLWSKFCDDRKTQESLSAVNLYF